MKRETPFDLALPAVAIALETLELVFCGWRPAEDYRHVLFLNLETFRATRRVFVAEGWFLSHQELSARLAAAEVLLAAALECTEVSRPFLDECAVVLRAIVAPAAVS